MFSRCGTWGSFSSRSGNELLKSLDVAGWALDLESPAVMSGPRFSERAGCRLVPCDCEDGCIPVVGLGGTSGNRVIKTSSSGSVARASSRGSSDEMPAAWRGITRLGGSCTIGGLIARPVLTIVWEERGSEATAAGVRATAGTANDLGIGGRMSAGGSGTLGLTIAGGSWTSARGATAGVTTARGSAVAADACG